MDLLDLYARASQWTLGHLPAAVENLDAQTPCEGWDVRQLLNHLRETQLYFIGAATGQDVSPPSPEPPEIFTVDQPGTELIAEFENGRQETLRAYGDEAARERTGPALGIAFSDQLLHGWDLATASGQDATMPDGLAESAFQVIHGKFTEEQRAGVFGPEIEVPDTAPAQDRLLAYSGRDPGTG